MDSLKFYPGPPCPDPSLPCRVFYPFGPPTPLVYEKQKGEVDFSMLFCFFPSLPLDFTSVSTILRNYIFGFRKVLESMRVSGAEIDKIEKKSQARTSQTLSKTERHWQKQGGGEEEEEGEEEDNILLAFSPRMEGICTLHRRRTVRRNGGTISRGVLFSLETKLNYYLILKISIHCKLSVYSHTVGDHSLPSWQARSGQPHTQCHK
jgi:hypothetical protein